jgi:hypothetical protein
LYRYTVAFAELARQSTVHCAERGAALAEVWRRQEALVATTLASLKLRGIGEAMAAAAAAAQGVQSQGVKAQFNSNSVSGGSFNCGIPSSPSSSPMRPGGAAKANGAGAGAKLPKPAASSASSPSAARAPPEAAAKAAGRAAAAAAAAAAASADVAARLKGMRVALEEVTSQRDRALDAAKKERQRALDYKAKTDKAVEKVDQLRTRWGCTS